MSETTRYNITTVLLFLLSALLGSIARDVWQVPKDLGLWKGCLGLVIMLYSAKLFWIWTERVPFLFESPEKRANRERQRRLKALAEPDDHDSAA